MSQVSEVKESKEAKEVKHPPIIDENKQYFVTTCYGSYQDAYFGATPHYKKVSTYDIDKYCAGIFNAMIQSKVITKETEYMIFLNVMPDHDHLTYVFRDMNTHADEKCDEKIFELCMRILISHGDKNNWRFRSSYVKTDPIECFFGGLSQSLSDRIIFFSKLFNSINFEDVTVGGMRCLTKNPS